MDLYSAQRTNFKPGTPRIASMPGKMRRPEVRSMNRGKKNPVMDLLGVIATSANDVPSSNFAPQRNTNEELLMRLSQMGVGGS